jgi:hypothetical protein
MDSRATFSNGRTVEEYGGGMFVYNFRPIIFLGGEGASVYEICLTNETVILRWIEEKRVWEY